jgi:predicted secreted protein
MLFTAPPVKSVPAGPVTAIRVQHGQLFSVALPHRAGKSWRIGRPFDSKIVREVTEADVGNQVVVVFRAVSRGSTKLVYALTRGESTTAAASSTYTITVR